MSSLTPSPAIVTINYFVRNICSYGWLNLFHSLDFIVTDINCLEVIKLSFIKVWQVPVYSYVFKTKIMPFICIRIVGNFVVMDIFSLSPSTSDFNELSCVDFLRSTSFIPILSRNPASVYDNSSTINFDWINFLKCILEWKSTTFITVKRINYIKTLYSTAVNCLWSWNKDFFSHIQLT